MNTVKLSYTDIVTSSNPVSTVPHRQFNLRICDTIMTMVKLRVNLLTNMVNRLSIAYFCREIKNCGSKKQHKPK